VDDFARKHAAFHIGHIWVASVSQGEPQNRLDVVDAIRRKGKQPEPTVRLVRGFTLEEANR
jgi:hypothetical protein